MNKEDVERFVDRMRRRAYRLSNQGEHSLTELLAAYEEAASQRDQLLDLAARALPYIECLAEDPAYKADHVGKFASEIAAAIAAVEEAKCK